MIAVTTSNHTPSITERISQVKRELNYARASGDPLKIDLAESALNDLLDRLYVTLVTRNSKEKS